uniref:hypothetical protein n=1 Tax=Bacillus fonticola TaxID=2728853 RepID=UPI0038991E9A
MMNCRTNALGGRAYECNTCGHTQVSYKFLSKSTLHLMPRNQQRSLGGSEKERCSQCALFPCGIYHA